MSANHPLLPSTHGERCPELSREALPTDLPSAAPSPVEWLTDDLLFQYQRCRRRAFLDLYGDRADQDPPSDYLLKLRQDSVHHRQQVIKSFEPCHQPQFAAGDWAGGARATLDLMAQGVEVIYQGILAVTSASNQVLLVSQPDLLIKQRGWSCWGAWSYAPISIKLGKKPKLDYQVTVTYHAYLLAQLQGAWPAQSYLALREGNLYPVPVERFTIKLQELIRQCLQDLSWGMAPEVFISHSRCDLCHWFSSCYQEAQATNHLSLLPGVTPARYELLQQQQLITLSALALAQPADLATLPGFGELVAEKLIHQAQSLLHNQPIPRSDPRSPHGFPLWPEDLPTGEVELFFDIEAAPDQNLIYLHGVLVVNRRSGSESFHAFLAEDHLQQRQVWHDFLDLVQAYPHAPIYHFCPYEAQTVARLGKLYNTPTALIDSLLDRFFDIHRCITDGVTLPIESYALKHIARWVGFDWRDEGANGAQSICWYNAWRQTGDRAYLEAILRYNEDDCRATYQVKDWLTRFAEPYWNRFYQVIG